MAARKKKKTDLAPAGQRLFDWSGGMNNAVNPALLNDNESVLLENYVLDEKGTLYPRKGSQNRYSSAFSSSPVAGMGAYYKSDGTSRLLVGTEDGKLFYDTPLLISSYDTQAEFNSGYKQAVQPTSDGKLWPMTVSTGFEDGSFADFHASDSGWTIDDTVCKSGTKSAKGSGISQKLVREFGFNAKQVYVKLACRFAETDKRHYPVVFMSPSSTRIEAVVADSDGNFKYHNGTALNTFVIPKTYTANTWYTVEVWIRNGTFFVSIDGEELTVYGLALKDTSNATQSQVAKLVIQNAGDAAATMWVDDVTVSLLVPVFTRFDAAYQRDGTRVSWNQPRYEYHALPYPVWQDTFDTDQLAAQYTEYDEATATWTVSDGAVSVTTNAGRSFLIKKDLPLQNFKIVVNCDQAQDGGITFCWQDISNHYVVVFSDASGVAPNRFALYKRVGGTYTQLAVGYVSSWTRGTPKQIVVFRKGALIEVYVDGILCISVTDSTYSGGSVGLRSAMNVSIPNRFLDFTVYYAQQGITMEEPTTNYLLNSSFETDTNNDGVADDWNTMQDAPGTGTFSLDDTNSRRPGTKSQKCIMTAAPSGKRVGVYQQHSVLPGTVWSVSYYRKDANLSNVTKYSIVGIRQGSTWLQALEMNLIEYDPDGWERYGITVTIPPDADNIEIGLGFWSAGDGFGMCWLDDVQLERKGYVTSWTPSTRSGETLTVPAAGVFNKGSWTVKLRYTPTSKQDISNRWVYPWLCYIDSYNMYRLVIDPTGRPYLSVTSGGVEVNTYDVNAPVLQPGVTYYITASGNGSVLTFCVNGVQYGGSKTYVEPAGALPAIMHISSYGSLPIQVNGIISDFAVMSRPQTLTEHQAEYYSGRPLQLDADTTYLLSCNGNLSPSATYTWTSPVIDASNAVDKASGHAALYADTPGGSTVAVQSRSASAPAGPWTAWVNALADGTLQHAPNDYVQVKLTMTRSGDDDPSVDKVVVSFDGQASATLLAGDFSPGGQFFFAQLLDYFVVVNGIDAPRKYDGSTLSLLGGSPPHASYVAAHKNRLWMARGSRLYFSDLLNIESWPVLNFIDIAPQDGDTITGLLPYGDYLVITKQRSTWLLTGEGINTFAVRRIHADRGAYAPRSLCIVNQMLCFISDDGIYFSDFTQPVLISERIRQTWNKLNKRRLNLAASCFAEHKLYVAVPDSGSQRNNLVIVYDTIRQAFAGIFTGWNVACWCDFREAGEIHTYFGCSDTGQVRRINVGYSDANQAFTARWESKHLTFGAPEIFKRWNRNLLQVKPAGQNATLRVRFIVDGVETPSMTVSVPADSAGFIHTLLVLASAVGVIGGHRIGVKVEQDVLDNPLGIQTVYIESMPITLHPTLRG